MELKLLTLMQSLRFPRKFKRVFSVSESNTKEAKMSDGSEKKQTFVGECCSAVFAFQMFLLQEMLFII